MLATWSDYINVICRNAAIELNRKSLMVEEAVEEVLELVKKAAQQFKSEELQPEFDFMNDDGTYNSVFLIDRSPFGIKPPTKILLVLCQSSPIGTHCRVLIKSTFFHLSGHFYVLFGLCLRSLFPNSLARLAKYIARLRPGGYVS